MSSQPVFTPEIKTCWCGGNVEARRVLADSVFDDGWQVACENDHAYSKKCNSKNRAIHRWNNRMSHDGKLVKAWDRSPLTHSGIELEITPMTYAQKFKAKVAEVMPHCSDYFNKAFKNSDSDKWIDDGPLVTCVFDYDGNDLYAGIAETICAVIDHEELTQVS